MQHSETLNITITNTGNQTVTLNQPTSSNYEIGALSSTTLASGQTSTFTICPKTGLPLMIETNMPSIGADITLPLTGIDIHTNQAEREEFLSQLAVYIEHSDGDKELVKGEIVEYKDGGIEDHEETYRIDFD